MASARGEFSSRFGFVMAAAGSAVGLGNIWGFPTQAASNGGAAFLLVYLVLAFTLAYPALMAELIIGRHAHANAVRALRLIAPNKPSRAIGGAAGIIGFIVASMILSFYAIVAGWMIAFCLSSIAVMAGMDDAANWLTSFGFKRNVLFMLVFMWLTIGIISRGVQDGIERWSARLMPMLLFTLAVLVAYVLTLDGAAEGLKIYLLPDFDRALSADLVLKALGSAFFSLSLGVGTMLIYGSYIDDKQNLPVVGGMVTLVLANRSQIVINLQKPLHEVWLATRSGGYHYRHNGQAWMDTKGQGDFWVQLGQDASTQAGLPLSFSS